MDRFRAERPANRIPEEDPWRYVQNAVWGENDDLIPLRNADLLVDAVASGKKVIIPGGTHAPYLSDPEPFHRELLDFCNSIVW